MTLLDQPSRPANDGPPRTAVRADKPVRRRATRELATQLALVGGAILLYFAVRGMTQGNETTAIRHGLNLVNLERSLGLDIEAGLQSSILANRTIVAVVNWIYIWGHWPVIAATLIWLHRCRRGEYTLLRNAMFASGAIGLVIFTLYPVAPPRLLGTGMVDTVTTFSNSYRVLQPPSLVNKYAALPSLHVGWNLLVGIALFRTNRHLIVRVLAITSPMAMIAAVILTANHYTVDAIAGVAVALTGLWIAQRSQRARKIGDNQTADATDAAVIDLRNCPPTTGSASSRLRSRRESDCSRGRPCEEQRTKTGV